MSLARSSQCVFCTLKQVSKTPASRRKFHVSSIQLQRQRFKSKGKNTQPLHQAYTKKEQEALEKKFTPSQVAAINAGEKQLLNALSKATVSQRTDQWSLDYFDDLSKVDPVVDNPARAPYENFDYHARLKTEDELDDDIAKLIVRLPEDATLDQYAALEKKIRLVTGDEKAEKNPRSALSPTLLQDNERFDTHGDVVLARNKPSKRATGGTTGGEVTPALLRLMQTTGYNQKEMASFRVKTIMTRQVSNQTRLGKIRKAYYLTVAGNRQGLVGIGEGKAEDDDEARYQSQYRAIRNMRPILRYERRTIYGDVKGKVGATELELYNRPPGFGLRCSQYIWEISRCAGIHDLAARVTRARNPMNTIKATIEALHSQKDPEEVARARGKKMVDVRKVYYARNMASSS